MKLKILIASRNRGKIAELHRLLTAYIDGAELELVSLDDVGFPAPLTPITSITEGFVSRRSGSPSPIMPEIISRSAAIVSSRV